MKHDRYGSSKKHLAIIVLLTSILFITACGRPGNAAESIAQPTTSQFDESDQSTDDGVSASIPAPSTLSQTVSLPLLQLDLPANWTAMLVDPEQALALPKIDKDMVMALSAERAIDDVNGIAPTLLAIQYPRHGLSLEDYLVGVSASLSDQVEVERTGILYDLRADGKPVGIIEYGNDAVGGYQIVQFDDVAENLILLTFTAPTTDLDHYIPEFNQIAAAIASQ